MRFASLASGSRGNALVAEAGATRVMLDCGLSPAETRRRLARLALSPEDISAIFLTHEHDDHVGGALGFAAAHRLPVYLTHGTLQAVGADADGAELRVIGAETEVGIGELTLLPFTVPHDAREPVQYVISDGARRLGVLSDLGAPTAHVVRSLSGCDALVLECNHDLDMLWSGGYPRWLKARIAGPFGHLDNRAAGELLAALDRSRLKHVIASHLSEKNNRPDLARDALAAALGCEAHWVGVATQDEGFGWRTI